MNYILVERLSKGSIAVHTFDNYEAARTYFDKLCDKNKVIEKFQNFACDDDGYEVYFYYV